jgi:hypothetical protein
MLSIIIFVVLQFINVVMSTLRTILTVIASKMTAALINAVSYTFYNGIVKLITGQELWLVLVVTFGTNLVGVWLAQAIYDRTRKDKLWIVNATVKESERITNRIVNALHELGIAVVYNRITENLFQLNIYSYNQKESDMILSILKQYEVKYCIIETQTDGHK